MSVTITAPGRIVADLRPVMEDHEWDISRGATTEPWIVAVVEQFFDESRRTKRGRGYSVTFTLETAEEIEFLRGEAAYRYKFNTARNNAWGNDEPQAGPRAAAADLIARCTAALEEVAR